MPKRHNFPLPPAVIQRPECHRLNLTYLDLLAPTEAQYTLLWSTWKHLPERRYHSGEPSTPAQLDLEGIVKDMKSIQMEARRLDPDRNVLDVEEGSAIRASAVLNARCRRIGIAILLLVLDPDCQYLPSRHYLKPSANGIKAHISRAMDLKDVGNNCFRNGDITSAISSYLLAFSSLCPYISDASMMTFHQAWAIGLLQLEYTLMANLLMSFIKLSKLHASPSEAYAIYFFNIGCIESGKTFASYKSRYNLLRLCQRLETPPSDTGENKRRIDNHDMLAFDETPEDYQACFDWVHEICCETHLELDMLQ